MPKPENHKNVLDPRIYITLVLSFYPKLIVVCKNKTNFSRWKSIGSLNVGQLNIYHPFPSTKKERRRKGERRSKAGF